jgi:hypothetical protein
MFIYLQQIRRPLCFSIGEMEEKELESPGSTCLGLFLTPHTGWADDRHGAKMTL